MNALMFDAGTRRAPALAVAVAVVVGGLLLAGAAGAWWATTAPGDGPATNTPESARPALRTARVDPAPRDLATREPASEAIAQAEARVTALVDNLATRLRARPDDAEGWQTLGRSYASLGRHAQAVEAFRVAMRLRPDDPTWLAEHAYSAAVLDAHGATGEPARLIAHALQIDAANPKALALAGTLSLDRKDYRGAVRYWEQLAQATPPNSPIAAQVQASIRQARQLAALQFGVVPARGDLRVGLDTAMR